MFAPDRTLVIHNPVSGRPWLRRRARALAGLLAARGFDVRRTAGPGHASEIAAEAGRDGAAALVVIGGDGSLYESIENLEPGVALAQFPTGTVNLLARSLGVPNRVGPWISLLNSGRFRTVYLGRCNARPFASVASAGFDAETVRRVSRRLKRWTNELAYAAAALRTYPGYDPPELRASLDGVPVEGPLLGVLVGRVPFFGGRGRVFPDADPGDPRLHVVLLAGSAKPALWKYAAGMVTGVLPRMSGASYRTASRVEVTAEPPASVELDGDYYGTTPVTLAAEERPHPFLAPSGRASGSVRNGPIEPASPLDGAGTRG